MHILTLTITNQWISNAYKKMKANLGIMITFLKSIHDNGLKLTDGMKLSDRFEKKIENLIDAKTINYLSEQNY